MKLVLALGNPGNNYVGTRHNTGFMAVDTYARSHKVTFADKSKFRASIAELTMEGDKVLLVKPTTFYNNVGESARALIDFYKLNPAEDLLVIHDDLALPFGTIRVREKGSDAGNNGVKSLNAHIGLEYVRLRIGIAVLDRNSDDAGFVLDRFTSPEAISLEETVMPKALEFVSMFLTDKLESTSIDVQ